MACPDCAGVERKYHEALQDGIAVRKELVKLQDKLLAQLDETERWINKADQYITEAEGHLDEISDLRSELAACKLERTHAGVLVIRPQLIVFGLCFTLVFLLWWFLSR